MRVRWTGGFHPWCAIGGEEGRCAHGEGKRRGRKGKKTADEWGQRRSGVEEENACGAGVGRAGRWQADVLSWLRGRAKQVAGKLGRALACGGKAPSRPCAGEGGGVRAGPAEQAERVEKEKGGAG